MSEKENNQTSPAYEKNPSGKRRNLCLVCYFFEKKKNQKQRKKN